MLVELFKLEVQFGLLYPNLFPVCVNLLKLFREVWQALKELFDDNDSKHESFAFATERFNDKLECNPLQHIIQQFILDYGSKKFSNSLEERLWIFVQKAILIEESVQDASINFLLLYDLGALKVLQGHNERLDSFVDLVSLRRKNVLKVFICGLINLFRTLCRTDLFREQDCILRGQVFNLALSFLADSHKSPTCVRSHICGLLIIFLLLGQCLEIGWIFEVFHSDAKAFLGQVGAFEDLIACLFKRILLILAQRAPQYVVLYHVLFAGGEDLLADVFDEGANKWRSNLLYSFFQPDIVVQKVPFSCQNSQIYDEFVILAVDDLYE